MLRFVVAAIVLAGAAAGCKGGGSGSDAQAPVTDDEFRWMAAQAVNAVLLTDDDLPANFDLTPGEEDGDDDDGPPVELTGECAEFNELINVETNFLAAVAEAETGDFENEDEDSFSSNAGVFRDAGAAEAEASTYQRFVNTPTCLDQLEAAFRSYFEDEAATGESPIASASFDVQEFAVPSLGDWAHGMRMSMTFTIDDGRTVEFTSDSVSVRVGRLVATVDYSYSGEPDVGLRDSIVAMIAARLTAEDADLPG